uniref:Myoglobin n=1 Tax=Lepidosiren paradoxus TaxID=7883 RepID=A0A3S4FGX6_LEPPA|nr:GbE2b [Lepidosiren paradoxa]
MALSAEEIQNATGVWSKIFADAESNGSVVLSRMFKEYPHTVKYFKNFPELQSVGETASAAEIAGLAEVQGHAKTVFTAFNDMVQHLENIDALKETATPLAKKHSEELKVDVKDFKILCDNLVDLVGEKQDEDAKSTFKKAVDVIYENIKAAY